MHGGNLQAAKARYGLDSFIDLSANINPFGPPKGVWDVLKNCQEKIIHYPDPESRHLRQLMAEKYNLAKEEILLGNGAGELIFLAMFALKPRKVLIPEPAFSEYERAALSLGAEIKRIQMGERGWTSQDLSDEGILAQWKEGLKECDLVFLNSPHNPTGSVLTEKQFYQLLKLAREYQRMIVLDESFVDFLDEDLRWTGRDYLNYPNLIVLYS
ncbi:MAG: aminotransferase class I/II-fold pyridoxal phosphate-dependent enzyme, partial [Desulfitobacterium sp.]|nr:aminotransferase class I/II-fold pyridoxal phosphate-dependent enzyme [Desulfitobacterium sp.]